MLSATTHFPTRSSASLEATNGEQSSTQTSVRVDGAIAATPATRPAALAPDPALVKCAGCGRTQLSPFNWAHQPNPTGPVSISHGLCPECCARVREQTRATRPAAEILRAMLHGNRLMARRLIDCGDAAAALRELDQACDKLDQILNQL